MFSKTKIILILIVLLGAVLRLYLLDKYPVGVTGDEIQQGYSAYSILKTGRDEWGEFLPLFPRGFGDYKPPIYTYLIIPSVAVFGLDVFAIRFPAALVGILVIVAIHLLVKEWFKDEKLALWSAFLLAVSPWHIQLSRTAYEAGAGVLLFSLGFWLYLKGRSKYKFLLLAALAFGLSLYTYHSFRVFSLSFLAVILFIDRNKIGFKKNVMVAAVALIFILPIFFNLSKSAVRFSDVTILGDMNSQELLMRKFESPNPQILGRIFDGRFVYLGEKFVTNYLSYYSPAFFFTSSRPDTSYLNFPYTPLMYLVELIFILFFAVGAVVKNDRKITYALIWLILAPIPAALTSAGGANRAITFLPLLSIISAIGLQNLIAFIKQKCGRKAVDLRYLLISILLLSLTAFLYQYFFHLPYQPINNLRVGYREIFQAAISREKDYNQIIFSHAFTEPQIFVAFYSKMDPRTFQNASQNWLRYEREGKRYVDQLGNYSLGKYEFKDIAWNDERLKKSFLFAGDPLNFPGHVRSLFEIRDRYDKVIFKLVSAEENKDKPI